VKITILVQVAYTNWNGGLDFCVKEVDGKLLYKKTLDACNVVRMLLTEKGHQVQMCVIIPDRPEERNYFQFELDSMGVNYFFGDSKDVLNRILDYSSTHDVEHIFRVNGSFWYLDSGIVLELADIYSSRNFDLVKLPANFAHGFAGEFLSVSALTRLRSIKSGVVVNPVSALLEAEGFRSFDLIPRVDAIDKSRIEFIRTKRLQYEPERADYNDAALIVEGSIYYSIYRKALEYIKTSDVVLDIASGEGYGSEIIAEKAKYVYGGDYNIDAVRKSTIKYTKRSNLNYVNVDVTDLPFRDGYFDVVTSMETVEHVDEMKFVENTCRVLKSGGYLIITTPQNNYGFNLTPWHIKEYSVREIRALLEKKFDVIKIFGCSSSDIHENTEAGDRMLIIAMKK
jgi:2-polyprenyl-3-methyl-5-hydroxy-6-metoxy-1,4-benzoquinol methylase